jgi:glucose 1-dehydrogenase
MKLAGKRALVTGAARGIGRGCALELARAGADVLINDRARTPAAEAVVKEIEVLGRQSALVEGNVFEPSGCDDVVRRALEEFKQLDILVSNPACSIRTPFLECTPETFQQVLQGTLVGGFLMGQRVARHMVERGGRGKIVFISSIHAEMPYVRSVAYNAAKCGLNATAFTMAYELIRHRINVNVIEPGWIDTPGEHESFGDDYIKEMAPKLPWGRLGLPEDIGKAAAFLVSDDADYITATILRVDGGLTYRDALAEGLKTEES